MTQMLKNGVEQGNHDTIVKNGVGQGNHDTDVKIWCRVGKS